MNTKDEMNSVGIYAGSFNPVHKGHIAIARACLEQDLVDEVWIIATGNYWEKNDLYPKEDRINMLKLVKEKGMVIDETYNDYPYTYMIFEQLRKDHPEKEFSLILGADNLPRFREWKNYGELLKYPFIILPRNELDEEEVKDLMRDLKKEDYHILNMEPIDISSTYIRDHLDDYEAVSDMIEEDVYAYLKQMKGH